MESKREEKLGRREGERGYQAEEESSMRGRDNVTSDLRNVLNEGQFRFFEG